MRRVNDVRWDSTSRGRSPAWRDVKHPTVTWVSSGIEPMVETKRPISLRTMSALNVRILFEGMGAPSPFDKRCPLRESVRRLEARRITDVMVSRTFDPPKYVTSSNSSRGNVVSLMNSPRKKKDRQCINEM